MTDRTEEFEQILSNKNITERKLSQNESQFSSPNEFIASFTILAATIRDSVVSYEKLIGRVIEAYIGYHEIQPERDSKRLADIMSDNSRKEFDDQVALFISTCFNEINDLRKYLLNNKNSTLSRDQFYHFYEISNFLLNRINQLSRISRIMRKERLRICINPFDLSLTSKYHQASMDTEVNSTASEVKSRLDGEIASDSKMSEYKLVASKYKDLLLKEAKGLQQQYHEDSITAIQVENSVEEIATMLAEFVQIIQTQTDQVEDIHTSGEASFDFVKKSNQELQTTIDRSQSSQWNTIILCLTLSVLLVMLDYITP